MNDSKSVNWVIGALMATIALFSWGYMAGLYATNVEEFRPDLSHRYGMRIRDAAVAELVANGLQQIPHAPAVISYYFSKQLWLPILIAALECAALGGGYAMKRVEQNLNAPPRRRW